ncbi:MAG TPA: UDP-N-acetylglucosamine--N-acetylmuramyl-(pentapeptide) pyrophosphoryl-undecaprenol N-acetylglucosamine transferase, partial [Flavobacteriaceae bacterium]|nr:UDP-N-acetylglucosamine--N-acetylmuramyl-(pentapeptide) pyrophosphoryl-undecaprenol N-acetylglucosamine transferase [Flavobacteriaceae bacterium]
DLDKNKTTLLVVGGSLGARAINKLVSNQVEWLVEQNVQVIWQTGKLYYDEYKKHNDIEGVQTHSFLNKMDLSYAAADVIISRAGAGSISELCIVGKPTIFIPSPNVSEDHQTKNAQAVVDKNAAILLKENELERFQTVFNGLIESKEKQNKLSKNIKKLALPSATSDIVNQIENIM